jgi:uncharacterized protein (TIGR02597 family)
MLSLVKEIMNMKKLNVALAILVAAVMAGNAQSTIPVGYVTTALAAGSDTIIAPQVFRPSELTGLVSSVTGSTGNATLAVSGASLTANQYQYNSTTQKKTYFALVTSGNLVGATFIITSNDTSSVTVNLNGLATPSNADITAIEIRPCWTIATMFPASDANISFVPSATSVAGTRRTTINIPNVTGTGINRSSQATLFYNNAVGDWVTTAATSTKAGDTAILPGSYVVHRNTGGTPPALTLTLVGEVFAQPLTNYLATSNLKSNDTYLALPRATDYTLSQLGLNDNSFTQSTSKVSSGRKDQLIVTSPTGAGINRSATATYFKFGGNWYNTAGVNADSTVIPVGAAITIRKIVSTDGATKTWNNQLNVSL